MKYTIHGLQQDKLIKLGLTNDDALILSVLRDRYSSMKMEYKIINSERYIWINYETLLHDIPILFNANNIESSKRAVLKKFKKYEYLKLIKRKTEYSKYNVKKQKNEKGTFSFFSLTINFDFLTEYEKEPSKVQKKEGYEQKVVGGTNKKSEGVRTKSPTKDNSIIDYPNKDNTSSVKNDDDVKSIEVKISKEDLEYINNYISEFKIKYKAVLKQDKIKELFIKKGKDKLDYYLEKYSKFLNTSTEIKNIAGYFYKTVLEEYPTPIVKEKESFKPAQATNYEQREYDDEFFDSLYVNLEEFK